MPLPHDSGASPESRVIRQLAEAILFEGCVPCERHPHSRGRLFTWGSDTALRCIGYVGAFGRIRIVAGSVEARGPDGWHPASFVDLVHSMEIEKEASTQLLHELEQTLAFVAWNRANLPARIRRYKGYAELDSALDEGHPYHPCFKARTGFSFADQKRYAPETGASFQLEWLAAPRDRLRTALPATADDFWADELGRETALELRRRMGAAGAIDAELVPLHPWQFATLKQGHLRDLLLAGHVHHLGPTGDQYRASQSVRTLFNDTYPRRSNIKLPMNIVNSSAMRTLDPATVRVAPAISSWLKRLVEQDPVLNTSHRLILLGEYAGMIADFGAPLAGQIGAIWRENLSGKLRPGECAAPLNALMNVEADGRPFIANWIDRHGLERWVLALIEVAVTPVFHLLAHHGVATECHGQNLILVHRDGWPMALAMQDFHDSIEYVPAFLRAPEELPDFAAIDPAYRDFAPNESYWMDDVAQLSALFLDCLFVYNLSEISHLLQHCYGFSEGRFWSLVRARIEEHARSAGLGGRLDQLALFEPSIRTESLLSRKVWRTAKSCFHSTENSLAFAETIRRIA